MSEIMKITDEREKQNKQTNKQRWKRTRGGTEAIVKGRELNDFLVHLSFSAVKVFLPLISKVSLTFKSNLELALSIILKQRELYESKHVAVDCRCLKIWNLLSFLMFLNFRILVLKWQVSPMQLELQLVFNLFKIKKYFSYKGPIPDDLKSFRVYKFTCVSCSSSYIGKTCRHFKTRIQELQKG